MSEKYDPEKLVNIPMESLNRNPEQLHYAAAAIGDAELIGFDYDRTIAEPSPGDYVARGIGAAVMARGFPSSAEHMVAAARDISRGSLRPGRELLESKEFGQALRSLIARGYPDLDPEYIADAVEQWVFGEPDLPRMSLAAERLGFSGETEEFYGHLEAYGSGLDRPSSEYMQLLPGVKAVVAYCVKRVFEGTLRGGLILLTNSRSGRVIRHTTELLQAPFTHIVSAKEGTMLKRNPASRVYDKVVYRVPPPHKLKPSPQAFIAMLKDRLVRPDNAVYIGDALTDAYAAVDAGMVCILVNRHLTLPPDLADHPRVIQIPSLADLAPVLEAA